MASMRSKIFAFFVVQALLFHVVQLSADDSSEQNSSTTSQVSSDGLLPNLVCNFNRFLWQLVLRIDCPPLASGGDASSTTNSGGSAETQPSAADNSGDSDTAASTENADASDSAAASTENADASDLAAASTENADASDSAAASTENADASDSSAASTDDTDASESATTDDSDADNTEDSDSAPPAPAAASASLPFLDGGGDVDQEPCDNGGQLIDNLCQCPQGFSGQYCTETVQSTCYTELEVIHSANGNTGVISVDGRHLLEEIRGNIFKVKVQTSDTNTNINREISHQYSESADRWGSQAVWRFDKQTYNKYKDNPQAQANIARTDGKLCRSKFNLDGTEQSVRVTKYRLVEFWIRDNGSEYIPYNTIDGTGSLNDVFIAINNGYEYTGAQALTYDSSVPRATIQHVWQQVDADQNLRVTQPITFVQYEQTDNGDRYQDLSVLTGTGEGTVSTSNGLTDKYPFDVCWHQASLDVRTNSVGQTDYLRASILDGRSARAIADGVSGISHVAYLLDNEVVFQIRPYMTPKLGGPQAGDTATLIHTIASTTGEILNCEHLMMNPANQSPTTKRSVTDMNWFVNSRQWTLAIEHDFEGNLISGDREAFVAAQQTIPADIHLVINFEDRGYTLSMQADYTVLSTETWASVEVTQILALDVTGNTWGLLDPTQCVFDNYLVSYRNGVRIRRYYLGDQANSYNIDVEESGTVKWYTSN